MLRATLRGRTRRSGRTSFNSSLGGCACSRFLRDRGVWQVLSLLDRPAALGAAPNVCEGNPATRKTNSCGAECRPLPAALCQAGCEEAGGGRGGVVRLRRRDYIVSAKLTASVLAAAAGPSNAPRPDRRRRRRL